MVLASIEQMSQHLENLHNSVRQYFPVDQYMMIKNLTWLKSIQNIGQINEFYFNRESSLDGTGKLYIHRGFKKKAEKNKSEKGIKNLNLISCCIKKSINSIKVNSKSWL